jgi:putative FmdB family regulatory protein
MPTYEYQCDDCGVFDSRRTIAERDVPASCPVCAAEAVRVIRSAPLLSSLGGSTRAAHAVNERAANEPVRSSAHGTGCGCCSTKVTLPRSDSGQGETRSAGGRPWMISH